MQTAAIALGVKALQAADNTQNIMIIMREPVRVLPLRELESLLAAGAEVFRGFRMKKS